MQVGLIKTLLVLCVCLVIGAICFGIAAAMASISPTKGRYKWIATTLFGSAICVTSVAMFVQTQLPVSHFVGIISSVQVHPEGKDYRTEVQFQAHTGTTLMAHAHGRSSFFRPGERVVLDYQTQTGTIVKAHFIAADGREEGVFNSADSWMAGLGLLIGLFIIWVAFRVNKRDPEGAEENWRSGEAPLNSVDEDSLLHLSTILGVDSEWAIGASARNSTDSPQHPPPPPLSHIGTNPQPAYPEITSPEPPGHAKTRAKPPLRRFPQHK